MDLIKLIDYVEKARMASVVGVATGGSSLSADHLINTTCNIILHHMMATSGYKSA